MDGSVRFLNAQALAGGAERVVAALDDVTVAVGDLKRYEAIAVVVDVGGSVLGLNRC